MEKLKVADLTPEFIISLYKKHKLKPTDSTPNPMTNGGHCCALGAVAVEKNIVGADEGILSIYLTELHDAVDFGNNCTPFWFACRFDDGFRGRAVSDHWDDVAKQAHAVGAACKAALDRGEFEQ